MKNGRKQFEQKTKKINLMYITGGINSNDPDPLTTYVEAAQNLL